MVRDYTQETFDRLLSEIDSIKKNDWCGFTDFLGDAGIHIGKWLGFISIDSDMKNIESYQRRVLDMNDTTKKELEFIFDSVYETDGNYEKLLDALVINQKSYKAKVATLSQVIQPGFCIATAESIKSALDPFNEALKEQGKAINDQYISEIKYAEKAKRKEAWTSVFEYTVFLVLDVVTLPVSMAKGILEGNPGALFSDCLGLIDDFFGCASGLCGLVEMLGVDITRDPIEKDRHLREDTQNIGNTGLGDVLADGFGEDSDITKGWNAFDGTIKAWGAISSLKGFVKDPKSMIDLKFGFKSKVSDITFDKSPIADGKYFNKLKKTYKSIADYYHYISASNVKNIFKLGSSVVEAENAFDLFIAPVESLVKPTKNIEKLVKVALDDYWPLISPLFS